MSVFIQSSAIVFIAPKATNNASPTRCQSQCSCCSKRGLPILYKLSSQGQRNDLKAWKSPIAALAMNAVVDVAGFPAVASALPVAVVMGDAGKFPVVASTVASAADPVADAVAFPAVALAIHTAAVMGDAGKIPAMASAVASVAAAGAISAVELAIPTAVVGWDAGKIPTVASATYAAADAEAIPTAASAIPAAAVVEDVESESIVAERRHNQWGW